MPANNQDRFPFLLPSQADQPSDEDKSQVESAIEIEKLVYEYKATQDEMLAIFDEVKEYICYEDLPSLGAFQKLPANVRREILKKEIQFTKKKKGEGVKPKSGQILFKDFNVLRDQDPQIFVNLLLQAINKKEHDKFRSKHKDEVLDAETTAHIEDEIEAKVFGKGTRLVHLLFLRFAKLQEELAAFPKEDLLKIKVYVATFGDKIRTALQDIRSMTKAIEVAKASKTVEPLRGSKQIADIYGVEEEKVTAVHELLMGAFGEMGLGKKSKGLSQKESEKLKKRSKERREGNRGKAGFNLGMEKIYDKEGNIVNHEFFAAYVNYQHELKNLYKLLNKGKIVETAAVRDLIERAMPALTKNPPTIVYFHGDYGTGKTALAIHISRTRFGKNPIVVSGSKFLDPDRLTEEFRIKNLTMVEFLNYISAQLGSNEQFAENTPFEKVFESLVGKKEELRNRVLENVLENRLREEYNKQNKAGGTFDQAKFEAFKTEKMPALLPDVLKDVEKMLDDLFSNTTQGRYVLGAMYTAMAEGVPLIIDEANAIHPEVLIAFNDLLTKKIGESIPVRADRGSVLIEEGYCVMWTGNTGERYKQARFNDMDPASYSRIMPIKVGYLPQSREVNDMNDLLKRMNLQELSSLNLSDDAAVQATIKDSKEKAATDQIFQVLVTKLLNKRLGAELLVRKDDRYALFKDLYRLSMGARILMDMFEGNATNLPAFPNLDKIVGSSDATVLMSKLKKSNLTLRELIDNIIGGYLDEGCSMDIEYYLYRFVQKYEMHPQEQAIIYAILQKAGFFDVSANAAAAATSAASGSPATTGATSQGWPNYSSCRDLEEFKTLMQGFNPLNSLNKYKRIRKNGESVSMLNTNDEYELAYFSSPEIIQLMYGYLPPRKVEEYKKLHGKHQERVNRRLESEEEELLLGRVKEIYEAFSAEFLLEVLNRNAGKIRTFCDEVNSYKMDDLKFLQVFSHTELIEHINKYCDFLIKFLGEVGKISSQTVANSANLDPAAKTNLILGALNKTQ